MIIEGKTAKWCVTVGIEVHAQINTQTKLFSRSATTHDAMPNTQTSLFDIATPGMLPVLNLDAIRKAAKTGFAINGNVHKYSAFDRKHYFYPDLPQGYQITQLYHPIVEGGFIEITTENGLKKKIRINRIHVEQDAGKLIHDIYPDKSCVDLNRAGIPLMEIVSEPDITSPHEACEYIKNLRAILRAIDTSDADMEKGNFRCDVNISVRKVGEEKFGTRCEIKNVNSIRSVGKAIEYEANRHVELIESGQKVVMQTRLFDAVTETTKKMRNKEEEDDYRYFPDPDLMPVLLNDDFLNDIKISLPELPQAKSTRYQSELGLSSYDAEILVSEKTIDDYFSSGAKTAKDTKNFVNLMLTELFGRLKKSEITLENSPVSSCQLAELSNFVTDGVISGKIAKEILDIMLETKKNAGDIIAERGLKQITNEEEILLIVRKILDENRAQIEQYKQGKVKVLGFFVGAVMKQTQGKANPDIVNKIILEEIAK